MKRLKGTGMASNIYMFKANISNLILFYFLFFIVFTLIVKPEGCGTKCVLCISFLKNRKKPEINFCL